MPYTNFKFDNEKKIVYSFLLNFFIMDSRSDLTLNKVTELATERGLGWCIRCIKWALDATFDNKNKAIKRADLIDVTVLRDVSEETNEAIYALAWDIIRTWKPTRQLREQINLSLTEHNKKFDKDNLEKICNRFKELFKQWWFSPDQLDGFVTALTKGILQQKEIWVVRLGFASWDVVETRLWFWMSMSEKLELYLNDLIHARDELGLNVADKEAYKVSERVDRIYPILIRNEIYNKSNLTRLAIRVACWKSLPKIPKKLNWDFYSDFINLAPNQKNNVVSAANDIRNNFGITRRTKFDHKVTELIANYLSDYNEHYYYVNHEKCLRKLKPLLELRMDKVEYDSFINFLDILELNVDWAFFVNCEINWEICCHKFDLDPFYWPTMPEFYIDLIRKIEQLEDSNDWEIKILNVDYKTKAVLDNVESAKTKLQKLNNEFIKVHSQVKTASEKIGLTQICDKANKLKISVDEMEEVTDPFNLSQIESKIAFLESKREELDELKLLINPVTQLSKKFKSWKFSLDKCQKDLILISWFTESFETIRQKSNWLINLNTFVSKYNEIWIELTSSLSDIISPSNKDILSVSSSLELRSMEQLFEKITNLKSSSEWYVRDLRNDENNLSNVADIIWKVDLLTQESILLDWELRTVHRYTWSLNVDYLSGEMANANSARDAILTTYDIREARKYYDLAKVSNERIKILAEQLVVDVDKLRQDLEDSQAKLISSEEMKNSLRTAFSVLPRYASVLENELDKKLRFIEEQSEIIKQFRDSQGDLKKSIDQMKNEVEKIKNKFAKIMKQIQEYILKSKKQLDEVSNDLEKERASRILWFIEIMLSVGYDSDDIGDMIRCIYWNEWDDTGIDTDDLDGALKTIVTKFVNMVQEFKKKNVPLDLIMRYV